MTNSYDSGSHSKMIERPPPKPPAASPALIKTLLAQNAAMLRGDRTPPFSAPYDGKQRLTNGDLRQQSEILRARLRDTELD
jgi:hypothetical protein